MPSPQTYKSHARFDPVFHFFIIQVFLLNFLLAIYFILRDWPGLSKLHLWNLLMAITFILLALTVRRYAAGNQDRIIRLEERLRLASLLPANEHAHINEFTTGQLIALRFASDAELPALAHRALTQNLEPKAIKQAIVNWRADDLRI